MIQSDPLPAPAAGHNWMLYISEDRLQDLTELEEDLKEDLL